MIVGLGFQVVANEVLGRGYVPDIVPGPNRGAYADTTVGPGAMDLVLSSPGWGGPQNVTALDLSMSWAIGAAGTLSADLTVRDCWEIGADPLIRLRGMWVRHRHPDWGDWMGVVTDAVPGAVDDVVEVAARGFFELTERLLLPKVSRPPSGVPGAVVGWAVRTVGEEESPPFSSLAIDELGDALTLQLRGQSLAEVIGSTARQSGQEWAVDTPKRAALDAEGRSFRWSDRIGRDQRREVELVGGVHVVEGRAPISLQPVENALYVTPADERYAAARGFWVLDPASIALVGRREGSRAYKGAVTRSTLEPIARAELARAVKRGRTARLDLVNEDGCFGWFDLGDTVRSTLPSSDMAIALRVQAASLNPRTDILTISGPWT